MAAVIVMILCDDFGRVHNKCGALAKHGKKDFNCKNVSQPEAQPDQSHVIDI